MPSIPHADRWPELPYAAWRDTCETLHLWTQIVGKIRLAQTPWLNHSWHVALYLTARGLTTSPIPYDGPLLPARFRLCRSCAVGADQRRALPPTHARPKVGCGVPSASYWRRLPNSTSRFPSPRCRARSLIASHSIRTPPTPPTTATMPTVSGACCSRRTTCLHISAPAFSAKRARCIFSGVALIWR